MTKRLTILAAAILLLPLSAMATSPLDSGFLLGLYGKPEPRGQGTPEWHVNGLTITSDIKNSTAASFIKIENSGPFSELQIDDVLKPFGPEGEWKQIDPKDWELTNADEVSGLKVIAHWDGESIIMIQRKSQP